MAYLIDFGRMSPRIWPWGRVSDPPHDKTALIRGPDNRSASAILTEEHREDGQDDGHGRGNEAYLPELSGEELLLRG